MNHNVTFRHSGHAASHSERREPESRLVSFFWKRKENGMPAFAGMTIYSLSVLAFLCVGAFVNMSVAAHAETLDEPSLRALYAAKKATVGDPDKASDFMNERLDDYFTLKTTMTQIIDDMPPTTSISDSDKIRTIESMVRGYGVMQVDQYESTFIDVRYSRDFQVAYVTTKTASSGTVSMPLPGGGYRAEHYEDGEGCVDQVTLVQSKLTIMKSACNEKFVTSK